MSTLEISGFEKPLEHQGKQRATEQKHMREGGGQISSVAQAPAGGRVSLRG